MEENPENYEMRQRENYPEYDNMNTQELESRRDELLNSSDWQDLPDRDSRVSYIDDILDSEIDKEYNRVVAETSFTDNDDGKTVTITNPGGSEVATPRVEFVETPVTEFDSITKENFDLAMKEQTEIENRLKDLSKFNKDIAEKQIKRVKLIDRKIWELYERKLGGDRASRDLVNRTEVNDNGSVFFKLIKDDGTLGQPILIMKEGSRGRLIYSKNASERSKRAIAQFKALARSISNEEIEQPTTSRRVTNEPEETEIDNFPYVETNVERPPISGLTSQENRELEGVLNPSDTMDPGSRVGPNGALQIQVDKFQETLNRTIDQMEGPEITTDEFIALADRANALEEARDRTVEQRELEEVREQQEEDVSRLQRFKEWAKENLVGLSAVAIAVAGIITTVIVSARGAIVKGAQATGKFAKALYNLGKKFGALLAPLFSILSTALSLAAKGLAWLASNLWVLAIAFTWFIYDQYKERRNKT